MVLLVYEYLIYKILFIIIYIIFLVYFNFSAIFYNLRDIDSPSICNLQQRTVCESSCYTCSYLRKWPDNITLLLTICIYVVYSCLICMQQYFQIATCESNMVHSSIVTFNFRTRARSEVTDRALAEWIHMQTTIL